jgi:ribosomal protein L36
MKILSSLKGWKKRGNLKQIRRGKQIVLIDPAKPKFKAKQGYKKK